MSQHRYFLLAIGSLMLASLPIYSRAAAQTAPNLGKEILSHKEAIQWRKAPETAVPPDVCTIFQACSGTMKLVTLPTATEGGEKVGRGLFWIAAGGQQKTDVFILEHQTYADVYFFLMSPDGALLKTAYKEPGKSWVPMGNGLSQPIFEKDRQAWQNWVVKMGTGAPKPAAAPKQE